MMNKNAAGSIRSIDELKRQYDVLNERKIQAQTQLTGATKQLEELQKEAVEQFGTCDIDELKAKLAEMEAENEKRRRDYQALLDGIEKDLTQVEQGVGTASGEGGEHE